MKTFTWNWLVEVGKGKKIINRIYKVTEKIRQKIFHAIVKCLIKIVKMIGMDNK